MTEIEILKTGLIYRNPRPHLSSVHAFFPSVASLPTGEVLSSLVLAEAFEATNASTYLARSCDDGETWQLGPPLPAQTADRLTSNSSRITALPDGELIAFTVRADRSAHPDEGLTSHETMGFAPTELLLLRSRDGGCTWNAPQVLTPPLEGPCWELCAPVTPLRDGRWILPTSTWRDWDGHCPNGKRMVAFVSHDRGETWPEFWDVMRDEEDKITYWESKIVELPDGRLLATAWAYDEAAARDLSNQYTVSEDGGRSWQKPRPTELLGQTLTPHVLDDGRILSIYRRMDKPGLWANVSRLEGNKWINECAAPLWGAEAQGLVTTSKNMAHNFNVLRFGAPCITRLTDGKIFIAFWCYEDCVSNIRWFKLYVE